MNLSFDFTIRYSKKEYLERFRAGELYFNTIKYFSKIEDSSDLKFLIKDEHDCATESWGWKEFDIYDNTYKKYKRLFSGTTTKGSYDGNIFCLTHIRKDNFLVNQIYDMKEIVDHQKTGLGYDNFVIISDLDELIKRLKVALNKQNLNLLYNKVNYIDFNQYIGNLKFFHKDLKYNSQNEFRFYIPRKTFGLKDVITLNIGDISDITSEILSVNENFSCTVS